MSPDKPLPIIKSLPIRNGRNPSAKINQIMTGSLGRDAGMEELPKVSVALVDWGHVIIMNYAYGASAV